MQVKKVISDCRLGVRAPIPLIHSPPHGRQRSMPARAGSDGSLSRTNSGDSQSGCAGCAGCAGGGGGGGGGGVSRRNSVDSIARAMGDLWECNEEGEHTCSQHAQTQPLPPPRLALHDERHAMPHRHRALEQHVRHLQHQHSAGPALGTSTSSSARVERPSSLGARHSGDTMLAADMVAILEALPS